MTATEITRELNYVAMFMLGLMIIGFFAGKRKTAYHWMQILFFVTLEFILFAGWNTQPDLTYRFPELSMLDMPFLFTLGPLLYMIFALMQGEILTRKALWHFLPAFAALGVFVAYFLKPSSEKYDHIRRLFYQAEVTFYDSFFMIGVALTAIYIGKLLYDYRKLFHLELFRSDRYVKLIVFILTVSSLSVFSAVTGMILQDYIFFRFAALFIAAGVHVFFIASFRYPDLHAAMTTLSRQKSHARIRLTQAEANSVEIKLRQLFETEAVFREESMSLAFLAERLQIGMYQLSEFLNTRLKKGFYELLHEYRVKDAEKKLTETDEGILDIAYSVGFNSKASFNRIFKKITGLTPWDYRVRSNTYRRVAQRQ